MSRNRELSQFPEFLTVNDTYGSVGIGTSLTVSGLGTFANDLYVGGTLYAPSLNITGGATLGDDLVTRNISASGIVTVTGTTDLNGDLDVDGHTELDNVRISGITTFESNIYLGNSDKVIMGGGDSFQLYHDGSNSYIVDSGAGDLYLRGTAAINFQNAAGTEDYAKFNVDGATELYYDNSKKLETTTGGISVSGNIVASGNVTVGGTLIYEDVTNVDSVGIATARAGLRITGGGLDVVGVATFNNGVNTLDVIGHTELDQLRVSGVSTFTGNIDANGDLDVDGHTELDNLNVSGVSTFVGIITSQNDVFVGNDLSVAGDARVVGVLTVGSSSVTIDGTTNTITVGTGATIHTTTVSINQLEVAGLSTFTGIGTFKSDLFVGGTLYTPALIVNGSSVGDDITTRNISASGIVTVTGTTDLNGDLDVDGHTELDNVNISGIATIQNLDVQSNFDVYDTLATFHNNLYIAGNLSIGGTTTVIQTQDLQVFDKDIILGVTTDINNNDVSTDITANHGGIAIASTEGSPLVDLYLVGLETSPVTYKKLMWFREGSFSGLGTDAWLSNYAVGIGSTQVPNGVRLAAGGVQLTDSTYKINGVEILSATTLGSSVVNSSLTSVGTLGSLTVTGTADFNGDLDVDGHTELDNVNVSGVITATSFVGDGSQLTGVSGFATALSNDQTSPLNKIFKTPKSLYIQPSTQADVNVGSDEGNLAFMRESIIIVGSGATFHIGSGTTLRTNVLNLF